VKDPLEVVVVPDGAALAEAAASRIATCLRAAVSVAGRATVALSGGRTPLATYTALCTLDIAWERVHVLQVDERAAPRDDPDRNLTDLRKALLDRAPIPEDHVYPMPMESGDLERSALDYERAILKIARGGIDVVHLGLGTDGHTASLVPGDPVLEVEDRLVSATRPYRGHRRLTLTYPALRSAHRVIWVVGGSDKAPAVRRLVAGDESIPAGRVPRADAVLICDGAAWQPEADRPVECHG